MDFSLVVKLL